MKAVAGLTSVELRRRSFPRWISLAIILVLGLLILNDATSSTLFARDPARGRAMGCYTAIELLVGVTQPTVWGRVVEWLVGLSLVMGASIGAARLARQMRAGSGQEVHELS